MKLDDIFTWTDAHFSHRRIMNFCKNTRPWAVDCENPTDDEIKAMDQDLIKAWNKRTKGKIIYFLGDFTFSRDGDYVRSIFDQLHGEKHLIKGNHDHKLVRSLPWSSIQEYKEIKIEDQQFCMSHYPMSSWNNMIHGSIHLYGHVHGADVPGKNTLRMFEPAVDNYCPEPVSLREVVELLDDRKPTNPPIW